MQKHYTFFVFFLLLGTSLIAQKNITVDDIYRGAFYAPGLQSLQSLSNGEEYIVIEQGANNQGQAINAYSYRTGKLIRTLLTSEEINAPIQSYVLSDDETQMLITTESKQLYRHSSFDQVLVVNLLSKKSQPLYEEAVRSPSFSPDGKKVAFVYQNNLYYKDLTNNTVRQITKDGQNNALIYGVTDWVYEEEFAFVKAYQWSPDSARIAFLSFDEREVPEFSMDVYGQDTYPQPVTLKYPKAGEKNAVVALHTYSLDQQDIKHIDLDRKEEFYIARIKYAPTGVLTAQVLNRHQNVLDFYHIQPNGKAHIAFTEKDKAYVDITDDLTFLSDGRFLWTSEKDNWRHIYLYSKKGKERKQLTKGDWEVTQYYGYDPKSERVYFQSTQEGSINRTISSVDLKGRDLRQLSDQEGTNSANFNADFSYFINTYSSATTPRTYSLHSAKDGTNMREIKNNQQLLSKLKNYQFSQKEFGTLRVNGNDLNMWSMKPVDYDPNKAYPLLMFQYSGPGSQQVSNSWYSANDYWHSMIANEGYIVVCIDGRGTGYKGADFKKVTQLQLGKYEVEDQIEAAQILGKRQDIDASRIGIWGWSYGGFMSSNCILKGADVFSTAIAVAPVTNWRFYDTIYTERYMTTPQENPSGYEDNSPINFTKELKGNYLLVHGTADDNVHVQNAMRMTESLVQANKDFDMAIYPDKNHGIYGGYTRIHLFNKLTKYIKNNL